MGDIIDAVSDFLKSDFAKDNRVIIITLIVFSVVLTIVVVSFIFNKLIIPLKLRESEDVTPDYHRVLAENEKLKEELSKYKNIKNMTNAIETEDSGEQEDEALNRFLRKRK